MEEKLLIVAEEEAENNSLEYKHLITSKVHGFMLRRFPKSMRLLKRRLFLRMRGKSSRKSSELITVCYFPNQLDVSRLGITVTKKYGSATVRNRFKRIVREAFRINRKHLIKGYDIVVMPKSLAKSATSRDISIEMKTLIGAHEKEDFRRVSMS